MLDGYDEYKRESNIHMDRLIERAVSHCFLLLTSRPGEGYVGDQVRDSMDGEVRIEGFSDENISKCSTQYLESETDSKKMLQEARESGIYKLLRVPIILLMVCTAFSEEQKKSLPNTKTAIVKTIFYLIMDRSLLKKFGLKAAELENLDALLFTLGEFSWNSLQNGVGQLLLPKVKN